MKPAGLARHRRRRRRLLLLLLLLLLDTGESQAPCLSDQEYDCPRDNQDVYTKTRDAAEIPKSVGPKITEMIFFQTSLSEIKEGAFKNKPNLVKLLFLGNRIHTIETGAFDNLGRLEELEISGAQLGHLPGGVFRNLSALHKLSLRDNQITGIGKGLFDGLEKLTEIYLHMNEIPSLPEGIFDGLPKLTFLHLAKNKISALPKDVFQRLTQLKILRLYENEISDLLEWSLENQKGLTELNLQHNRIQVLPPNLLKNLPMLEKLFLDNNCIKVLPEEAFFGLRNIKQLKLASNQLEKLPSLLFDLMPGLKELDLSRNHLQTLPGGVFANLTALTKLTLSGNQLVGLPAGALTGLERLEQLNLERNNLSSLDSLRNSLPELKTLKVCDNHLENIPVGLFESWWKLCSVELRANPWRCDCHLLYLHSWMRNNPPKVQDASKVVCRSPEDLAGKEVSSLTKEQFICITTTPIAITTFTSAPAAPPITEILSATGLVAKTTASKIMTASERCTTVPQLTTTITTILASTPAPRSHSPSGGPATASERTRANTPGTLPGATTEPPPIATSGARPVTPRQVSTPAGASTATLNATTWAPKSPSMPYVIPTATTQAPVPTPALETSHAESASSQVVTIPTSTLMGLHHSSPSASSVAALRTEQEPATPSRAPTPLTSAVTQWQPSVASAPAPRSHSPSGGPATASERTRANTPGTSPGATSEPPPITTSGARPVTPCQVSTPAGASTATLNATTWAPKSPATPYVITTAAPQPAAPGSSCMSPAPASPSPTRVSPPNAGTSSPARIPSFTSQLQAWGFSLSSSYQYCPLFLTMFLSMLFAELCCTFALARFACVLYKITCPRDLPSVPVKLKSIKYRKENLDVSWPV